MGFVGSKPDLGSRKGQLPRLPWLGQRSDGAGASESGKASGGDGLAIVLGAWKVGR